jgi:hypothetical protein
MSKESGVVSITSRRTLDKRGAIGRQVFSRPWRTLGAKTREAEPKQPEKDTQQGGGLDSDRDRPVIPQQPSKN